jgi:hypothetical protein
MDYFVCPKLLLETNLSSLTPKADHILDDKAMNLSLIKRMPLAGGRPGNPHGEFMNAMGASFCDHRPGIRVKKPNGLPHS